MASSFLNAPRDLVITDQISLKLKSHTFPLTSRIIRSDDLDDLEMLAFRSKSYYYTSLRDLLPAASPTAAASPTLSNGGSWKEIPIKDPLVQHAAWAYLQPMAAEHGEDGGAWWRAVEKKCCGVLGCFNDVVLVVLKRLVLSDHRHHESLQ